MTQETIYIGPDAAYVRAILTRNGIEALSVVDGPDGRPQLQAEGINPTVALVVALVSALTTEGVHADTMERIATGLVSR